MSLGSQVEAETISTYSMRRQAWVRQSNYNKYAMDNREWHSRLQREFERGERPDGPGTLQYHYSIGPMEQEPTIPDGWEEKGSGISRTAYLSPSGVIYKLERKEGSPQSNRDEHEFAESLRSLPPVFGAMIPQTALYRVGEEYVIAMEFMDGEFRSNDWSVCFWGDCTCGAKSGYCSRTVRDNIATRWRVRDLHAGNVAWVPAQRKWAVVDLGCVN